MSTRATNRLSKHHLGRYAPGPDGLDWANQPDPFRTFAGAPVVIERTYRQQRLIPSAMEPRAVVAAPARHRRRPAVELEAVRGEERPVALVDEPIEPRARLPHFADPRRHAAQRVDRRGRPAYV